VALVSDAGTPLISDPGFMLVREALAQGLPVIPVPGATAAIAALTASGLPADRFLFAGFLPPKAVARRAKLATLAHLDATLVFYEAPQRLAAMLADAAEAFGTERQAAVCRELTKAHETVTTGEVGNLADAFAAAPEPKGEIVVVVAPPQDAAPTDAGAVDAMLNDLAETMPASKAAAEVARLTGLPKGELYKRLLALKGG
nr:SAM-dependent methyltransferase [Rhizobiaceae bacterium]